MEAAETEVDQAIHNAFVSEWSELSAHFEALYYKKNKEYGDADLEIMGESLRLAINLQSKRQGKEAAILFYLLGKISRAISAMQRGETGSDDTVLDIVTYGMMLAMVRSEKSDLLEAEK